MLISNKANLGLTYALLVFIWSTTPLAIVWSITDIYHMWALALRFFLALPLAFALLYVFKVHFPYDPRSIHSYIAGACSFIGSQFFTYLATSYLSSGMLALMFGLAPIMAGLIGHFVFKQYLALLQWFGLCIAVMGLAIICLGGSEHQVHPIGIALMLISVMVYSASIFWVKKVNAPLDPIAQASGSILVSSLVAACALPFIWQHAPTHLPNAKALFGLFYAVVMASLLAMFCYFKLLKKIKATTLSLTTVLTPMLAMVFGAMLNHEQLTMMVFVGASILLLGLLVYFIPDLKASRDLASKSS
jgi:drug/metabolite transporter (DMT)-like permease